MEEVSKRKNKRHAKNFIKDDEAGILISKKEEIIFVKEELSSEEYVLKNEDSTRHLVPLF
jgi:hypothetical protein